MEFRHELLRQIQDDKELYDYHCYKCKLKPLNILILKTSRGDFICLCEKCYNDITPIFDHFRNENNKLYKKNEDKNVPFHNAIYF